jgi:Polyketide cyclase / dehydrase and lipid transport
MQAAVEQRIRRPPQDVAAFAMDPGNDRQWIGALRSVRTLTGGPVGPGTRVERVAGFLGRRIRYVNEISEYEPGRRLAMRSVEAPFPMTVAYDFEPADGGGTLVRITAGGDPRAGLRARRAAAPHARQARDPARPRVAQAPARGLSVRARSARPGAPPRPSW